MIYYITGNEYPIEYNGYEIPLEINGEMLDNDEINLGTFGNEKEIIISCIMDNCNETYKRNPSQPSELIQIINFNKLKYSRIRRAFPAECFYFYLNFTLYWFLFYLPMLQLKGNTNE